MKTSYNLCHNFPWCYVSKTDSSEQCGQFCDFNTCFYLCFFNIWSNIFSNPLDGKLKKPTSPDNSCYSSNHWVCSQNSTMWYYGQSAAFNFFILMDVVSSLSQHHRLWSTTFHCEMLRLIPIPTQQWLQSPQRPINLAREPESILLLLEQFALVKQRKPWWVAFSSVQGRDNTLLLDTPIILTWHIVVCITPKHMILPTKTFITHRSWHTCSTFWPGALVKYSISSAFPRVFYHVTFVSYHFKLIGYWRLKWNATSSILLPTYR